MLSFVGSKATPLWIWLAFEVETRRIVGCAVGRRPSAAATATADGDGAKALWDSLPEDIRRRGEFFTDFWGPYASTFPSDRHRPVGKETGLTSYLERFNNTLRQRVGRLARQTLSFFGRSSRTTSAPFSTFSTTTTHHYVSRTTHDSDLL